MQELQAQRDEAAKLRLIERKKRQKKTSPGLAKQMTLNTAKYQKMVAEAGGLKPLIMAQNWIHRPPKSKKDRKKMEIAAARKKEYDYTPGPTEDSPIGEPVTDLSTLLDYLVPIKEQEENPRYFMESTSRPPPHPTPKNNTPKTTLSYFSSTHRSCQHLQGGRRASQLQASGSSTLRNTRAQTRTSSQTRTRGQTSARSQTSTRGQTRPGSRQTGTQTRTSKRQKIKTFALSVLYPNFPFPRFVLRVISAFRSFETQKFESWVISLLDKIEVQQQSQTC